MKRHLYFLFTVIFIFLVYPGILTAASDSQLFGYVNVAQAVIFHPLMAKFDMKEGRFDPSALGSDAPKNRDKAKLALETKRKELLAKKDNFDKVLSEIDKSFEEKLKELVPLQEKVNATKGPAHIRALDEYNKRKGAIEREFWKKREDAKNQVNEAGEALKLTLNENATLHLSSPEETERIFKIMLDDVYFAIDAVTKHYNLAFVFNSSFSVERTPVNPGFTPENPIGGFLAGPIDAKVSDPLFSHAPDGKAPLYMSLKYWSACQRWAFRNCVEPRLDRMVLKGGVNMTSAVVDWIYQKYKIDQAHRDIIQKFFQAEAKGM
ncbi:hypothetical protein HYY75_02440 [bacterium]|nr:hypothetical protein [bacterium]